jgi:hypothetical protein
MDLPILQHGLVGGRGPALANSLHGGCCALKAARAQDDKPSIPCRLQGRKEPATSDPGGPKHSPADASLAVHAASWIDAAMRIYGASASYRDPSPPSWWLLNPQRDSRFDPMLGNCSLKAWTAWAEPKCWSAWQKSRTRCSSRGVQSSSDSAVSDAPARLDACSSSLC